MKMENQCRKLVKNNFIRIIKWNLYIGKEKGKYNTTQVVFFPKDADNQSKKEWTTDKSTTDKGSLILSVGKATHPNKEEIGKNSKKWNILIISRGSSTWK